MNPHRFQAADAAEFSSTLDDEAIDRLVRLALLSAHAVPPARPAKGGCHRTVPGGRTGHDPVPAAVSDRPRTGRIGSRRRTRSSNGLSRVAVMATCLVCFLAGSAFTRLAMPSDPDWDHSNALFSGTLRCGFSLPPRVSYWPGTGGDPEKKPTLVRRWVSVDDLPKLTRRR